MDFGIFRIKLNFKMLKEYHNSFINLTYVQVDC